MNETLRRLFSGRGHRPPPPDNPPPPNSGVPRREQNSHPERLTEAQKEARKLTEKITKNNGAVSDPALQEWMRNNRYTRNNEDFSTAMVEAQARLNQVLNLSGNRGNILHVLNGNQFEASPEAALFAADIASLSPGEQIDPHVLTTKLLKFTASLPTDMSTDARREVRTMIDLTQGQILMHRLDLGPDNYLIDNDWLRERFAVAPENLPAEHPQRFFDRLHVPDELTEFFNPSQYSDSQEKDGVVSSRQYQETIDQLVSVERMMMDNDPYWNDPQKIEETVKRLQGLGAAPDQVIKYYTDRLRTRIHELRSSQAAVGAERITPERLAEAYQLQKDYIARKHRFIQARQHVQSDPALQENPDQPSRPDGFLNPDLRDVAASGYDQDIEENDLFAIRERLMKLKSGQPVEAGKLPITDPHDMELAQLLYDAVDTKFKLIKLGKEINSRMTDEMRVGLFRELNYSDGEINWIGQVLSKPDKFIQEIQNQGWDAVKKRIMKNYSQVYERVDQNQNDQFEDNFDIFRVKPVYETLMNFIRTSRDRMIEVHDPYAENMRVLYEQLEAERGLREYSHNVFFLLRTRGDLKTLAGFSKKLVATDVDKLFRNEEFSNQINSAYRLLEKTMTSAAADNLWTVKPTWFYDQKQEGDVIIENAKKLMRAEHRMQYGVDMEKWEQDRAMNIARGMFFGVTTVGLDRLGECDAPKTGYGQARGFQGYFGDAVLARWNPMRHQFERWWEFDKKHKMVMYDSLPLGKGNLLQPYTMRGLYNKALQHKDDRLTNLNQTKDWSDIPIINISNFCGLGGIMTRGGWRNAGMVEHLIVHPDDAGMFDFHKMSGDQFAQTWKNLGDAGTAFQYYWAERLETVRDAHDEVSHVIKHKIKHGELPDIFELYSKKTIMKKLKEKNPMFFVWFDKTMSEEDKSKPYLRSAKRHEYKEFKQTFRGKALTELGLNIRSDYSMNEVQKNPEIQTLDNNCILISELLNKKAVIGGETRRYASLTELQQTNPEALNDLIPDAEEKVRAIRYWQALQSQINDQVLKEFSDRVFPYTIGTDDIDLEKIRLAAPGGSIVSRAIGDIAVMDEKTITPMMSVHFMWEHMGKHSDEKDYMKFLDEAAQGIDAVHGEHFYEKWGYAMTFMGGRWIQKDASARLPFGIGSLVGLKGRSSWAKEAGGRKAFAADEQRMNGYIENAVGVIAAHAKGPYGKGHETKYNVKNLQKDLGAVPYLHVAWDIARSSIPLALLFIIGAAATLQFHEESKESHQ